jgi:hypothetical protein
MKREILLFVDNKEQIFTGSCFEGKNVSIRQV